MRRGPYGGILTMIVISMLSRTGLHTTRLYFIRWCKQQGIKRQEITLEQVGDFIYEMRTRKEFAPGRDDLPLDLYYHGLRQEDRRNEDRDVLRQAGGL